MARRCFLAFAVLLTMLPLAQAVITAPVKLSAFLGEADYIVVAKIDSLDAEKGGMVLSVQDDLKGKLEFRRMPAVIKPDEDAVKLNHVPQLLKRLAPGLPLVVFISREDKEMKTYAYTNGTWIQLLGKQTDKDRAIWVLTHGEPYLRKMYKGTTAELVTLVKDVLARKVKPPDLDDKTEPGFGPELPAKSSRLDRFPLPLFGGDGNLNQGPALFAVIPTLGIAGPIAILAILFPTVFGGVLILFRQWTAFITMFSINSTLYLLYWWKGADLLTESWWGSDIGVWSVMTLVTILCTLWAWRRQLANLTQGADGLETPAKTEFLVLGVLTLTCVGFIVGTWFFAPPQYTDIVWNLTLVLAAGIVVGLLYKTYRSIFEVMLPMATEGVMLGVASLASLAILIFFATLQTGSAATKLAGSASTDASGPQLKGIKWTYESKRKGIFASSPLIFENGVYAASSHPPFGYGFLYRINLDTGKEDWKFGGGIYKRAISSPVVSDGRVYIGEGWHGDPNCSVYCINAENGTKIWDFPTANQTEATPAVLDGKVYTGCGNDGFRCLTAGADGKAVALWRFPDANNKGRLLRFASGAQVIGGKVFVGTGVDRDQPDDKGETALFCLDAATGKQIWKIPMPLPVWTTPVVSRGELFVTIGNGDVFDDADEPAGAVDCLNPENGAVKWRVELPNGVLQQPAVDKYRVYFGCRDGGCYALDRTNGSLLWKVNLGEPIIGTPAMAQSAQRGTTVAIYAVSTKGLVACIAPDTGFLYWKTRIEDPDLVFLTAPAVAVRPIEGGEEHLLVIGAGNADPDTGKLATLICLEGVMKTK